MNKAGEARSSAGDAFAGGSLEVAGGAQEAASVGAAAASPARRDDAPIIVHCHLRWDFVWQRPQQILSRLAENHPVLFVEDPVHDHGPARLDVSEAQPNLWRVVPVLPHGVHDVDRQCELTLPLLRELVTSHPALAGKFERPVQWFYSPMTAPGFLGAFDPAAVVYDCMDELANFRFAPTDIGQRETQLLERADLVYTGGYQLFESKSRRHDRVRFYGCGVDTAHYAQALDDALPVPGELRDLPKPVFGYIGVIDERLDYELVAALADAHPEGTVVMAGPLAKVTREDLPDRPNIRWLGQQAYANLPAIAKAFDVCLMPFALNEATRYINPTKTLEYLAAGKPVVSTPVADVVRNFGDVVYIADGADAFVAAATMAATTPDPGRRQAGLDRAAAASWDSTVASMRQDLLQVLS